MKSEQKHWFPAKRDGWGWGLPSMWQGWVVYLGYVASMARGVIQLRSGGDVFRFLVVAVVSTVALLVICMIKGEPTRWRWGGD